MDALACLAEEGRKLTAKVVGELSSSFDPAVSEWGNPPCRDARDPSPFVLEEIRG